MAAISASADALGALAASRAVPRRSGADAAAVTQDERRAARRVKGAYSEVYTEAWPDLQAATPLVVGVTSALRGEGRSTTALGTALAIARDMDVNVLLLELDLERPSLARALGVREGPGLVDILGGRAQLGEALHELPCGVHLLPAGTEPEASSRLLRSSGLRQLLDTARQVYDVTVLDLPPALANSDVVPLSNLIDGLLLTVRAGATPARLVDQAVARFAPGKVRGIVLNGQRSKIPSWLRQLI